jgi:glycosyltransferase involved in cell wall biosynthesis
MVKKIRILFIIGQLAMGGAERQMVMLAQNLAKSRYEVLVCSLSEVNEIFKDPAQAGVNLVILNRMMKPDITRFWRLARVIRDFKPDIIHTFLFSANFWGRIFGKCYKIPVIVSERSADTMKPRWQVGCDRLIKPWTNLLVANSQAGADAVISRREMDAHKIAVIHNGIDLEDLVPADLRQAGVRQALNLDNSQPIIGLVGRLSQVKDHEMFFKVVDLLRTSFPGVIGLCIGDGPRREELEAVVKHMRLTQNIRFLGLQKDIPALMQIMDVVILTSRREGLPNVLLEAMLQSKPIVATNVGGIPEVVCHGHNGYLVASGGFEEMTRYITNLINHPDLAVDMGKKGYQVAKAGFSRENMVSQYQLRYEQVLNGDF